MIDRDARVVPGRGGGDDVAVQRITGSADFARLLKYQKYTATAIAACTIVCYFGFIFLLAFAPHLMHERVTSTITIGFPLGLGVMIVTFLLVLAYVHVSNRYLDDLIVRIRKDPHP